MQVTAEPVSLRDLLRGERITLTPFVFEAIGKFGELLENAQAHKPGFLGYKDFHQDIILRALREKADVIRSIVDRHCPDGAESRISEVLEPLVFDIIRVVGRSAEIRNQSPEDQSGAAIMLANELTNWVCLCSHHEHFRIADAPRSLGEIRKCLFEAASQIASSNGDREFERNQLAMNRILSALISGTNPYEIMRQSDQLTNFVPGHEAFDVIGTIDGVLVDAFRSRQFIYGIKAAVEELERRFPAVQEIRIADLGSGPFGFLGLVALAVSDRIKVEFIELNPQAVLLLETLIDHLNLKDRAKITAGDAFDWNPEEKVHGIISETIGPALIAEPFANLIQSARKHLHEGGIIVPEAVCLRLSAINIDKYTDYPTVPAPKVLGSALHPGAIFFAPIPDAPGFLFNSYSTVGQRARFILDSSQLQEGTYYLRVDTEISVFGGYQIGNNTSLTTTQLALPLGVLTAPKGPALFHLTEQRPNTIEISYLYGQLDSQVKITPG